MESYFLRQTEIYEELKTFLTNFKKDGASRKTVDYCNRKMTSLETSWHEYCENHKKMYALGDLNHVYFTKSCFETAEEVYMTIKLLLEQTFETLTTQSKLRTPQQRETSQHLPASTEPRASSSVMAAPEHISLNVGSHSTRLREMIKKQNINFRAFLRTVSTINVDQMQNKWEFEDALKSLQSRWTTIDQFHWEIEAEDGCDDMLYQSEFTKNEITFNELKKTINTKMWSVTHRDKSTPQMDIPVFNGNYHHWISFKDLFDETIHRNPSLSSAQKMQFLKNKVTGEAERLIHHLPISADNYQVCWEILNHRFNNKRLIFTSHINTLLSLPNMQQQSLGMIKKIHDVCKESLYAIRNLGVDITTWDPILVHLLAQKLDGDSFAEYLESVKTPRELPILQEFLEYLESKFTTLEVSRRKQEPYNHKTTINTNQHSNQFNHKRYVNQTNNYQPVNKNYNNLKPNIKSLPVTRAMNCVLCNADHGLWICTTFLHMTNEQKLNIINKFNLCKNCFVNHYDKPCYSKKTCRKCFEPHNTLLHEAVIKPKPSTSFSKPNHKPALREKITSTHVQWNDMSEILLATAMINLTGADGTQYKMRALVDQGSQISLISENAAQLLGLKRNHCKGKIYGVGEKENNCKGIISVTMQSIYSDFTIGVNVIIMNNLIKSLPNSTFVKPSWPHIQDINLADPEFFISRPVDVLLGADIYSKIMLGGILRGENEDQPIAQQTKLGWLLCGSLQTYRCNVVLHEIDELKRFWEIEDITSSDMEMSSEDHECMQYFLSTTRRLENGRYEVRIPFKPEMKDQLGHTKPLAIAQFRRLEEKLNKNLKLKEDYQAFLQEYLDMNHMLQTEITNSNESFLPHHAVIREESTTSKLRVVFNASARSSSGLSLNDIMHKGPNLQQDLQLLILKWRQYQFVHTADIEKMYRQILIHPEDQPYQKILWRESINQPIIAYQLMTVTYGTKAAPFLAMMCLKQLAKEEKQNYPDAAKALEQNFYMDDYCGGSHTIAGANKLRTELIQLLQKGGFNLRKWTANDPRMLEQTNDKSNNQNTYEFKLQSDSTKTLGLNWKPNLDKFTFKLTIDLENTKKPTKRSLLSDISKLFDPLGWLTPLSTTMKIIFQKVWLSKLDWNDTLPSDITTTWAAIKQDLPLINTIEINRWLGTTIKNQKIQLHGFCDASNKAYACVIYCRVIDGQQTLINIVAAKARLAPLNKNISIPRLELMGAQLLSQLIEKVQSCLTDYHIQLYCWIDSTAVLGWLQGSPEKWKPFVSNRVKLINKIIPSECWRYVKTSENPADCATRGLSAKQLRDHQLWWQGPPWLQSYQEEEKTIYYDTKLEIKPALLKLTNAMTIQSQSNYVRTITDIINNLLEKYSSTTKIIRIFAWILRLPSNKRQVHLPYLTLHELQRSKLLIIKTIQQGEFPDDMNHLLKQNKVHCKSSMIELNPFIDKDGVIRVGGRLKNAEIPKDIKHPVILPPNHRFTTMLIQEFHTLTFHGGARLTLTNIRQQYWIIKGFITVKKIIKQCVTCKKFNPRMQNQIMGDLPACRVNPESAFYHCGVDYTGFIEVKSSKGRGIRTTKGYIALFICMVTKAVHIEIVSDLSTTAFIGALHRLSARRGAPRHVYSDNGTNFVGANRQLQEEYQHLKQVFNDTFYKEITILGIEWHFNAPSWPSAGGLWERAVRSLKHHLKRVIGCQILTFEEYATLLARIEACLNTRPLCSISENIDDLDCLTPAHFLTGSPGLTIIQTEDDARTRWHLTTKLFHDLWKKWKIEYLTQLQARNKWTTPQKNIEIGDLVVIQEDHLPPGTWRMGRVLETHSGDDGYIRVVTLKTKNGVIKRPIVKLSILPVQKIETSKTNTQPIEKPDQPRCEPRTRKRRPKRTLFSYITATIMFIMLLFITSANGEYSNVKKLSNNQSLYFDPISKLQLVRDKWTLIVYFDMEPYWEGIRAYNKIDKYLEKLCNTTFDKESHCDMIVSQLRHDYQELQYYNELLLTQHFNVHDRQARRQRRRRRRRGLINGVGYLANELFGVLDSRFAEQYASDIENTRQNEKHLLKLLKNQTTVIESEFNLMKRMQASVDKQHKTINKRLNDLETNENRSQSQIQKMFYSQDFVLSAMASNSLLQSLKRLQETLLDTITDIYHGQISLHLLTPNQLRTELQTINSQMINDLKLPIQNIESELRYIYRLLRVKARVTQKLIIFEVTFPLVGREEFQLYKLIPIPHQINEKMITIIPAAEYSAVNLKHDSYFTISNQELTTCIYNENSFICQLAKPILHIENDESYCDNNTPSKKCKTEVMTCKNKWVELNLRSQYLYFCCDIYTTKIICNDNVTIHQLSQAGVIRLAPECIIKGKNFVLYPLQKQSNAITISPDIYVPEIDQINHMINLKMHINSENNDNLNNSFIELRNKIETIKSQESDFDNISYHDIHQYTISYTLLAMVLCGIAVWVWRSRRCCRPRAREEGLRRRRLETTTRVPLPPPPPPPPPPQSSNPSISGQARKQSTADPSQSSNVYSERKNESIRFQNLAARWPSVNRGTRKMLATIEDNN